MRMEVKTLVATLVLFAIGGPVRAAISPGVGISGDPPGELFYTVWDATNQVTYTRDLGISIVEFLGNPNQTISLAPDALYTSTFSGVDSSSLVYTVAAFNNRFDDFPGAYGYLIGTNSGAANVSVPDITALQTELANGASYVIGANSVDGGNPVDYVANRSGLSHPGDSGYWGDTDYWNGNLGNTTPFSTQATVGSSLAFFALLLNEGGETVDTVQFANVWTLAANGMLTYAPGGQVPLPAAAWLLLSALTGLVGVGHGRRS
jgi:hypothetical protein